MKTRNLPVSPKAKKHFKKSTLAMCMAALTAQAYAQDDASSASAATVEEVVVYGIAQSLEDAQDIKRNASTVTDVITASDIGALPDKSIIEALQRVPGVAIQRFASSEDPDHFSVEGGGITVRGMNRIRAEFNGRDGFSAGADGGLNFSDIPPEMVGSVEVSKNQTADMVEGGISGTINLITRKPFDSDDLILQGTVRGSYGDLIEEVTPSFSGVASNVWETDAGKFGALLSLSASEFSSRGDGVGVFNFYPTTSYVGDDPQRDYWAPSAGSVRQQENSRDRLGFSTALQWANPSETVQATLEFIHSDSELTWSERFLEYGEQPFVDAAGSNIQLSDDYGDGVTFDCPTGSAPCQFTSGTILKSPQAAEFNGVPYYLAGARSRYNRRVIDDLSFNLEYMPNDQLTITADLQHTKATNEIDDTTVHGKFYSDAYLDLRDETAGFEMLDEDVANPASYFMRSAMDFKTDNEGDQSAFQLDGEYVFSDGWVTAVKAGIRLSNKTLDVQESNYNWGSLGETWMGTPPLTYDQYADSGVVEQFTFENHLQGSALQGNDTFWFPSVELLKDTAAFYAALQEPRVDGPTTSIRMDGGTWVPLHERSTAMDGSPFRPSDLSRAEEDRQSVYVRVDFGDDNAALRYSGNIGLRYVNWQLKSTGANVFGPYDEIVSEEVGNYLNAWAWTEYGSIQTDNPELYAQNQALLTEITQYLDQLEGAQYTIEGEEFSRVLPSFNLKIGVTDDLIVRLAASEAMFMPNLIAVRNSRTVTPNLNIIRNDDTSSIEGVELLGYAANGAGNPHLQPELSTNLDLAVEWYFDDFGSLTSTLFHKKVRDYFRQSTALENLTNSAGLSNDVMVTNTQNAGTATIKGYELAYQGSFAAIHESLADFGIQASYTYIDGESTDSGKAEFGGDPASKYSRQFTFNNFDDLPLEGLSEDNYNLVLFYDNGTFQSRFAYNWRSAYMLSSRDVIAFAPVFGESTGQLDASFSWQVSDNFKVGIEANNLLDEVTRTSILNETTSSDDDTQQGIMTPRSYFSNDRRFSLFVQAAY